MIIRSRAPVRISLGGGGTDLFPYIENNTGVVLSTTIDRYAYATVSKSETFEHKSNFDSAAVDWFDRIKDGPLSTDYFTEAPAGSGLGGSSSLMVALVKALSKYYGNVMSAHEIAEAAWHVERRKLGIEGGYQDQFAAAYGGWNIMQFKGNARMYTGCETTVCRLFIGEDILMELLASLILVDLGKSRVSSGIIKRQVTNYAKPEIVKVLDTINDITLKIQRNLISGHLKELGLLLSEEWMQKKKLEKHISNATIDRFHTTMLRRGAIGGKLLGAGDGGHMLFLSDLSKRQDLLHCISDFGFKHIPFRFDSQGVVAWTL